MISIVVRSQQLGLHFPDQGKYVDSIGFTLRKSDLKLRYDAIAEFNVDSKAEYTA